MSVARVIFAVLMLSGASICFGETLVEHFARVFSGVYVIDVGKADKYDPIIKVECKSKVLMISWPGLDEGAWDVDASTSPVNAEEYISLEHFGEELLADRNRLKNFPIPKSVKMGVGSDGLLVRGFSGYGKYILVYSPSGFVVDESRQGNIESKYMMIGEDGVVPLKKVEHEVSVE
jgi:hypothetical protein